MLIDTTDLAVIEADLNTLPRPLPAQADPIAVALRQRGHRFVSTGLRTAQVDGRLYDLDARAQVAVTRWLSGEDPQAGTVRLVRRHIAA